MRNDFIYVIEAMSGERKKIYKIGKTGNVHKRYLDLSHMSPVSLKLVCSFATYEASKIEGLLHRAFVHRRSHGEWFFLHDCHVEWLKGIRDFYLDKYTNEITHKFLYEIYKKANPNWWMGGWNE